MGIRRENPYKEYVSVNVNFMLDGRALPCSFTNAQGETLAVDHIFEQRVASSLKAGGQGLRYRIRAAGRQLFLFRERDEVRQADYWFIEREVTPTGGYTPDPSVYTPDAEVGYMPDPDFED